MDILECNAMEKKLLSLSKEKDIDNLTRVLNKVHEEKVFVTL